VKFAKAEAHGNDFLLVREEDAAVESRPTLARAICDRLRGVGADGLILYGTEGGFSMTLYNSDGSPAEISGNGLRCLAAYLAYRGASREDTIEVSTKAGRLSLSLLERRDPAFRFRANMGCPRELAKETLVLDGERLEATTLSLGNPHCVLFPDGFDRSDLLRLGPRLERHPRFPAKTNVEMVAVLGPHEIRMAIWERGAGETQSSGTGSSASAVAAIWNGLVESPVTVRCPGGDMRVEWTEGGNVLLEGEATVVAEGTFLFQPEVVSYLDASIKENENLGKQLAE
jgi:diaminopimelate epimerase